MCVHGHFARIRFGSLGWMVSTRQHPIRSQWCNEHSLHTRTLNAVRKWRLSFYKITIVIWDINLPLFMCMEQMRVHAGAATANPFWTLVVTRKALFNGCHFYCECWRCSSINIWLMIDWWPVINVAGTKISGCSILFDWFIACNWSGFNYLQAPYSMYLRHGMRVHLIGAEAGSMNQMDRIGGWMCAHFWIWAIQTLEESTVFVQAKSYETIPSSRHSQHCALSCLGWCCLLNHSTMSKCYLRAS